MATRELHFESLKTHAWLGRVYHRLSAEELSFTKQFIRSNDHLDRGEFELVVNRMFLGADDKPKHWREILELLSCTNTLTTQDPSINSPTH